MPATTYFRARHVATMTAAGVIDDGCVAVDAGRIVAVGRTRDVNPPRVDHAVDGLLTPGLINAHTHLELTNVPRPPSPGTFQDWLLTTMGSMRRPDVETFNRDRETAVRDGVAQCVKFGVTCVGDVSQNVDVVRPILREGPIRSISYGECLGLGPRHERFDALLARATNRSTDTRLMQSGVSPHAPYTVDAAGYAASWAAADAGGLPWSTHLAETPDEMAFVFDRSGPFMDLYAALGFDPGPPDAGDPCTPVAWLARRCPDFIGGVLAHGNDCTDNDLTLLAEMNATVAFCPRTHAYFDRPPHRWRDMLRQGVNVCVATDSCASSPDLNVMDDLRLLRRSATDVPAAALWDMVTFNAAVRFAGAHGPARNGILHPSRPDEIVVADLIAWPTRSDDPLADVLDTPGMLPSGVWVGGDRIM